MRQYDPYYDPWAKVGEAASNAYLKSVLSRPNPQEQAMRQAEIEAKQAMTNKYNLESQRVQGQLDAPTNLSRMIGDIFNNPQTEGQATPLDQNVINQRYMQNLPDMFASAMQYAGDKPGSLGDVFRTFAANLGANPEQITNAQLGSGMAYDKTREGVMNNPFTLSPGAIRFDAQGKQVAAAPFKPAMRSGGFSTTLPDGTVIEYGGMEATKSTTNDLQKEQVSNAKLRNLINFTRDLAKKDPTNFGFPGFVKGTAQDVTSLLGGVSQAFGYRNDQEAVTDAQREIASSGVDPSLLSGVFDPNLPALQTASDLLVFQAASALAGQSGRSVSDRDVKMFKQIVGDPQSLFGNQEKFLSKLTTIENMLQMNEGVADTTLRGNVTGPARGKKSLPNVGSTLKTDEGNYRYLGGNPNDQSSWELVQ